MSDPGKAVFLSYASQDAEAVQRIAEALRAAGIEVWFDQAELVGGDAWDAKIRSQIASCALFMPVISAHTQARLEGYFRLEWKIAAQRTHTMAEEKAFLLPIVIDETRDAEARVPAEFRAVQWTRLPAGDTTAAFCARVRQLLAADGLLSAAPAAPSAPAAPARAARAKPNWIAYGWAAVGIVFALVYAVRPIWSERGAAREKAAAHAAKPEAAPPLERALRLRALDGLTRERLGAADELLAQALKADPTDADALALAAQVDALMVYRSWDLSDERRQSAAKRSARAIALAPDAFEARRAQAMVAAFTVRSPESLREAETTYRALAAERAGDENVLEELGAILVALRRHDEAAQIFTQAHRPQLAGNAYYAAGRIEDAQRIADDLLAQRRTAAALILKANVALFGFNDLAGAQAAVDQLTPSELREDDAAGIALRLAVLRRDAPGILRLLEPFPHPFVSILGVNYPRQYWTGLARSLLNQPEAAQIEWRGGMRSIEERLQARPNDYDALSWAAMFHAALGERSETEQALRTYANYSDLTTGRWDFNYCVPLLRLGLRHDEVVARLAQSLRDTARFNRILYAWARYSPEFDPVRGTPAFERLLRETRPKLARPFDDEAPASSGGAPDEGSVAVLAFANLSDDKANEYFSDGISEELLNVLAKVPGLKVSARTSAFFFKGKEVPIPEIARQLGVAYVVEGSVRKSGDKVRITAQLIKAAGGFHVWSDTFTRDLKDIFAVQDEIAGLIAQNLRTKLSTTRERPAPSPAVYALILQARHAAAAQTNEGARRAIEFYQQALAQDAKLADAWAEVALCYVQLGRFGGLPTPDAMREARIAARRALDLEPEHPFGWLAMGWVQRTNDRDWRGAIASFRRALESSPENVTIMSDAAICFLNVGFTADAEALATRAAARDPLNPRAHWSQGAIFLWSGRPALAVESYRRAVALAPAGDEYHSHLARALALIGRYDEAMEQARLEPNERYRLVAFATIQFVSGDTKAGDRTLQEISTKYGDSMSGYLANLCAIAGKVDDTFKWLEQGYESRDAAIAWVKTNASYRSVTSDPRWEQFLRKMGLADDQLR